MDHRIQNIKMFGCLDSTPNGHTAYKTEREPCVSGGQAVGDNGSPPPDQYATLSELLDESLMAVDFASYREIDRLFLFLKHSVGCRSPPSFIFVSTTKTNLEERKMAQYKRIPYEMVEHTELARISYADYERGKDAPDEIEIEAESLGKRAKLRQALGKLTPRQREVYVLKVGYQLSEAKIAQRLHISQTGVSYHFRMAEKKLQENTVK